MLYLRCDADEAIGMGHLSRCLLLADALRGIGVQARILMRPRDEPARRTVAERGRQVAVLSAESCLEQEYSVYPLDARAVVLDLCHQLSTTDPMSLSRLVSGLKSHLSFVAVIDGLGEEAFRSLTEPVPDLVVTPYLGEEETPRPARRWLGGARYAILPPAYATSVRGRGRDSSAASELRMLMTLGGADPWRLTERLIGLVGAIDGAIVWRVVIGPLVPQLRRADIKQACERSASKISWVEAPDSLLEHYLWADAAVSAPGLSKYELAALGVPALLVCADKAAEERSRPFLLAGIARTLLVEDPAFDASFQQGVRDLALDPGLRENMSRAGRAAVDGRGAQRVAEVVAEGVAHAIQH